MTDIKPRVGMPTTIYYITNQKTTTVVYVSAGGRKVIVREDSSIRTDNNGMSDQQTYTYTQNPEGKEHTFYRRAMGYGGRRGGKYLALDSHQTYYDYSF